jgi:tricorn protease
MMHVLGRIGALTVVMLVGGCAMAAPGDAVGSVGLAAAAAGAADEQGKVGLPQHPSLSPDGRRILFAWQGDIWSVERSGGGATRMTAHDADERRTAFSPDGSHVAFESARDGYTNLYITDPMFRNIRQVTFGDQGALLGGWTPDGAHLYFAGTRSHSINRERQTYSVPVAGGPVEPLLGCLGRSPSVAPDGDRVAFVRGRSAWSRRHYRGPAAREIWVYDRPGDSFTQVTTHLGNDGQPRYLADGSMLYLSDRDGAVNVYHLPADATDGARARRLTNFEEDDVRDLAVSQDGSTAAFVVWDRIYTLDLTRDGALPQPVDVWAPGEYAYAPEESIRLNDEVTEAALSPDGKTYALVARGEVFVQAAEGERPARRVTDTVWREQHIVWSADGETLYFVSDQDGMRGIYSAVVTLDEVDVRGEDEKPAEEEEANEESAAGEAAEDGDAAGDESDDVDEAVAESDEEPTTGEDAADEAEEEVEEEPEPRRKEWARALRFETHPVLVESSDDYEPQPSPDGKYLAFRRGLGQIWLMDIESGETSLVHDHWTLESYIWSPDGSMMAVARDDRDNNADIWIFPIDGSAEAVNVTRHPDNDYFPTWSADGKILAFASDRIRNDSFDVYAVYLDRSLEGLPDYELNQYYEDAISAAKKRKPIKPSDDEKSDEEPDEDTEETPEDADEPSLFEQLDLDDAYLRLRTIANTQASETGVLMTPGGDRLIFNAFGDESGLYSIKWDGSERTRLDSGGGDKRLNLSGSKLTYVHGGRARSVSPGGGKVETLDFGASIVVDIAQQQRQKFLEASRLLGEIFYHPTMKGLDWPALTEKYLDLVMQTRTDSEFELVASMFIGELNASHLGVYNRGRGGGSGQPVGYLGAVYDLVDDGYRVTHVYDEGPASADASRLDVGDVIVAVEEQSVPTEALLEQAMAGTIGKEVLLTVRRADAVEGETELVLIEPISWSAERMLAYYDEVERNAALVEEWSDGRLGYVHIRSMDMSSLHRFERDLYAVANGKDGLLIDVRSNGGGWTADMVLASIMVQPHAYTVQRGADPTYTEGYPQDRRLIYAYSKPINMLCNEQSFSNAEIVSHAFKTLGRGTLVGQQTYGGVISTGGTTLIDGTWVRLPMRGWYLPDGTDMELNGAMPDIVVPQTPEDEVAGFDRQLKVAVDDLLERI